MPRAAKKSSPAPSDGTAPADSVLCNSCWHPINNHRAGASKQPGTEEPQWTCNTRLRGVMPCRCRRSPNQVALAVIAGVS